MSDVKTDSGAEYLLELADANGISVSSVSDGHVFIMTRKHLLGMLAAMDENGSDRTVIFVKRAEPADAN